MSSMLADHYIRAKAQLIDISNPSRAASGKLELGIASRVTSSSQRLRIVFIGQNGLFTIMPLLAVSKKHAVVGIIESGGMTSQIDWKQKVIRHAKTIFKFNSASQLLRVCAKQKNIPYLLFHKGNHQELVTFLRRLEPDVICIASMSQLLRREAWEIPRLGTINVHPSLLPKYRGPSPWFWHYHQMESEGGVTIFYVDDGEDTGDILKQASYSIAPGMELAAMQEAAISMGTGLLLEALDELAAGKANPIPQRHLRCPLRARNVNRHEAKIIDWENWPIERVWHFMRGTQLIYDSIPPPQGWRTGFRWKVKEFSRELVEALPGTIQYDSEGCFVAHRQGKIRLTLDVNWVAWAKYWLSRLIK